MEKVSIIIPVYNVENFINRCLDSILNQTYSDFEVLLVDDGSTDKSGLICDDYVIKDSRFKVFHIVNSGVSFARNIGIENSTGKWIMFVDSDDWLEYNTLENCLKYAQNSQLIRFGMKYIFSNNCIVVDERLKENWSYTEYLSKVVSRETILGVWGGLYRRSVFEKNRIRFSTDISLGEDWLVLLSYLKSIDQITIIDRPFYNYNRCNEGSVTSTLNINKFIQLNRVANKILLDPFLNSRVNTKCIASLKANVCSLNIANLLISKSPQRYYKKIFDNISFYQLYPSFIEIIISSAKFKYKIMLLCFSIFIK